jgi:serine/threonine protein kinase
MTAATRAITQTSTSNRTLSTVASSPLEVPRGHHRKVELSHSNPLSYDRYYRAAIVSPADIRSHPTWDMHVDYTECELVGKGSYGEVVRANSPKGSSVAIKRVDILEDDQCVDWENGLRLLREIYFLRNLSHRNVAKLVGLFPNNPASSTRFRTLHIVTDYCHNGSLSQYQVGSLDEALRIQYQVLSGLEYLHSQGILHRDIKRENIFVRNDGSVVLGDFGLSRSMTNSMTAEVVTKPYRCPSLLLGRTSYGPEVDIYAAGIVFIEMLYCKANSTLLPNKKIPLKSFLKHQIALGFREKISPDLILLGQWMHVDIEELVTDAKSDSTLQEWANKVWAIPVHIRPFVASMITVNFPDRPSAKELLNSRCLRGIHRGMGGDEIIPSDHPVVSESFDESIARLSSDEIRAREVKSRIWDLIAELHPEWRSSSISSWFPGERDDEEPVSKRTRLSLKLARE